MASVKKVDIISVQKNESYFLALECLWYFETKSNWELEEGGNIVEVLDNVVEIGGDVKSGEGKSGETEVYRH